MNKNKKNKTLDYLNQKLKSGWKPDCNWASGAAFGRIVHTIR